MAQKQKKFILLSIISVLLICLLAGAILFSYQKVYAGKIYKNVFFANLDLSGMTRKEAQAALTLKLQEILNQEITLKTGEQTVSAKLVATGFSFNITDIINDSYEIGRQGDFFETTFGTSKTLFEKKVISATPIIDQDKYNAFIKVIVRQLNRDPVDASLVIKNGQIVETQSQDGQTVDTSGLDEKLVASASQSHNTLALDLVPVPAAVKNEDFSAAKKEVANYLSKTVTFAYNGKTYKPSPADIGSWIEFKNNNGQYYASLSDSNIKTYLTKIAKDFEVKKVDRKINASTNEVISEGVEGLYLDKDKALAALKQQMASIPAPIITLATYAEAPIEIKVFPNEGFVAGRFEGKYIDIDLTTQRLCRVEGPTLIDCSTISSGKAAMPTRTGTYHIQNKNPRQWSSKYGLWMPWWEAFDGAYGIHELPEWPGGYKEGEAHLGIPVSHGCVRLGVGPAETLYNWTEIGTPVYIHK